VSPHTGEVLPGVFSSLESSNAVLERVGLPKNPKTPSCYFVLRLIIFLNNKMDISIQEEGKFLPPKMRIKNNKGAIGFIDALRAFLSANISQNYIIRVWEAKRRY
jgi:hypothetical protein